MDSRYPTSLVEVVKHRLAVLDDPRVLAVVVTLSLLFVTTRLLTGKSRTTTANGVFIPPQPSYWLPFAGHGIGMALNADAYLTRLLKQHTIGIFTLRSFGSIHHIVANPSLFIPLLDKPSSSATGDWLHDMLMHSNFGLSKSEMKSWQTVNPEIAKLWHLLRDDAPLKNLVQRTTQLLKGHIADFVTFNSYAADQMEWEQLADAQVVETDKGEAVVEADLHSLIKNFVARIAVAAMFGTDFVDNFPEFPQDLWAFDERFVHISMRIPFWIPIPGLGKARAARDRMIARLEEFHTAFDKHADGEDPGVRWENLDNVGELLAKRQAVYRRGGLPIHTRACLDLGFLWALNANSNPLVFWMLYEICQDSVLLAQIRDEIKPYLRVVQPENEFGLAVWVAPEIEQADAEGLVESCPILKSAYLETLRIYTSSYTLRWVEEDVVLGKPSDPIGSFLLEKGSYAHVPHGLHQQNPAYFADPAEFLPARHLHESPDSAGVKQVTAETGTMRPFGGGSLMCKGRVFAARQMLLFTAAIISMYDISPAKGPRFDKVGTFQCTSTKHPKKPVRVRIKRRAIESQT